MVYNIENAVLPFCEWSLDRVVFLGGTLRCHIDGLSYGSLVTTSRLSSEYILFL